MSAAEWYFDFVSPFAYVQFATLARPPRGLEETVEDELSANGERAIAIGVFGVPTFAIDGELFWGCDATGMALDCLTDSQRFNSGEMARSGDLRIAAHRT
jgi:2-hydroxychromene-2-carboxylate isomerase